jgi:DNA-binding MarR family transcriptional regulator
LVRRRRSTSDGRAVRIALTEKGEAAFTETLPWASEVQNKLMHGLSPADVARMRSMLKIMFSNIHEGALDKEVSDESAAADTGVLDL